MSNKSRVHFIMRELRELLELSELIFSGLQLSAQISELVERKTLETAYFG